MAGPDKIPQRRDFATTQWSVVLAAGRDSSPHRDRALAALCQTYWRPLYAYAVRRTANTETAQDMTQAFFAELLEKDIVHTADPNRGRFRAFLITAFKHFITKQWDKAKAQKRGGGREILSLNFGEADSHLAPANESLTPEQVYERQWAITLLDSILTRLRDESVARGKETQFDLLKNFLLGDAQGDSYADVAQSLGISEAGARQSALRLRRRYAQLLRSAIAETVSSADEVEDEIHNLFAVLQGTN